MNLAIEDRYGKTLHEAIKHICDTKDVNALEDWRRYYTTYLLPLDREAQELIQKKYNLIRNDAYTGNIQWQDTK